MSDFLTQSAWAKRCGVSARTFFGWRQKGLIPIPDVTLPGVPRWTVKLVEQTMRGFKRPVTGRPFGQKGQAFRNRRQQRSDRQPLGAVSRVHAERVRENASAEQVNSVVGGR